MNEGAVGGRATCARHRNVETYLRCGKCGTPICPKCLVHTPVGARCPKCAAPPRSLRGGSPLSYILAGLAGLGVGMVGGIVLAFFQFGVFAIVPLILTGFLVGETIGAVARRAYSRPLAIVAFTCAVVGPLLGRAALVAPFVPAEGIGARVGAALVAVGGRVGGLELLLLIVAGVIAATRVQDR